MRVRYVCYNKQKDPKAIFSPARKEQMIDDDPTGLKDRASWHAPVISPLGRLTPVFPLP